jgi:7-cyano-7-deazaguanine synthase
MPTGGCAVPHGHYADPSQSATVVPNRNMVFLSLGAARAVGIRSSLVLIASHAGDAPIYPDCRAEFFEAADKALKLACGVGVFAPFVEMTKGEIVATGRAVGVDFGLTCYEGGRTPCGQCGACVERAEAIR